MTLKYPMKKSMRIRLGSLYYELAVMPGLDAIVMTTAAGMASSLLRPKKLASINDLRLDWRPLHDMLVKELFPKRRKASFT
jgi:proteasome activator subunit 4